MPDEPLEITPDETPLETSEAAVTEETQPETVETPAEKEIPPVPYEVFRQSREALAQARQDAEMARAQNQQLHEAILKTQLQQQQQQRPAPRQRTREEAELAEILNPFIQEAMQPLVQDYQQKAQMLENFAANQKVAEAENYVMTNVPDFRELAPDLQSWLNTQTPGYRDFITSHPDNVVLACNMVRALKTSGGRAVGNQVRDGLKGRAASETGGTSPRSEKNQPSDYTQMTAEEFSRRDAEIMRRSGRF